MITIFLNCGLRVQELVNIDITDFKKGDGTFRDDNKLPVIGKGSKKRNVYLNAACCEAIDAWLKVRTKWINNLGEKNPNKQKALNETALFISRKSGQRLTVRRVQQLMENEFKNAGLSAEGLSAHKLRHTCATLYYNENHTDLVQLRTMLGHKSTITTEVYTHLSDEKLQQTMSDAPLAEFKPHE